MINKVVLELSLRDLRRSKKALFAGLVSLIPLALAILAFIASATERPPNGAEDFSAYSPLVGPGLVYIGLMVTIPLVCLILAGGSIADEAEERTLSYLLVRPIPRSTLYASRTLAVMLVATTMAIFQAISVWIVDALSFMALNGSGQRVYEAYADATVSAGALLGIGLPLAVVIGALAAAFYVLMFSAISIVFPRYHFFANLLWFGVWELGVGFSETPVAWLSGSHNLRMMVGAIDPTLWVETYVRPGFASIPAFFVFLALAGIWIVVGWRVMKNRDFHITSAAT